MTTANTIPSTTANNRPAANAPAANRPEQPSTVRHVADSLHLSGALDTAESAVNTVENTAASGYNYVKSKLLDLLSACTLSNSMSSTAEDDKNRQKSEDVRADNANWYAQLQAQVNANKAYRERHA